MLLVPMVWVPVSANTYEGTSEVTIAGPVQATPTVDLTVTALLKEQLILQNKQLQQSEDRGFGAWLWNNAAAIVASLLSTLVLVGGVLIGFWQWRTNRDDTRAKESNDRKEAQDRELRERAEERFQTAVAALGSENPATQIGGATLLRSFLHKEDKKLYERYYTQIFDLAVSHLRLRHLNPDIPEPLDALTQSLATVFKEVFPLARTWFMQNDKNLLDLDAIGVKLDSAYLARSDLRGVRLPEAYLRGVNFYGAKLSEANLREAKLQYASLADTELIRTNLARSDLRKAVLTGVLLDLTGANLDGADLTGANLDGANIGAARSLKNTDLRGVKGLSKEQLEACRARGAIVDEETMANAFQPIAAPLAQSNSAQVSPATSAQATTPPLSTDGSDSPPAPPSAKP